MHTEITFAQDDAVKSKSVAKDSKVVGERECLQNQQVKSMLSAVFVELAHTNDSRYQNTPDVNFANYVQERKFLRQVKNSLINRMISSPESDEVV